MGFSQPQKLVGKPVRIVLVSPVQTFPPTHGAARRIYDMGKALGALGHKVTILNLTVSSMLTNQKPMVRQDDDNVVLITGGLLRSLVLEQLVRADIVQFEFPYLVLLMILFRIVGKTFVLDEHDVEFLLLREIRELSARDDSKRSFVSLLGRLIQRNPALVFLMEAMAVRLSSLVFACSEIDAARILQFFKLPREKVIVIPNSVSRCLCRRKVLSFNRPTLVFVGSFDHLPNVYAARVLVDKIMPAVSREVKDVLCVVVGRKPPSWLIDERSNRNLLVTGEVSDIGPYIAAADVTIAPIYQGSGTRLKIIEYMAMGKPVVSTTKGVEGLEVENEVHALVRDDPCDFAEAIVKLIKSKEVARKIAHNAQELVRGKYTWGHNVKRVLAAYEALKEERESDGAFPQG